MPDFITIARVIKPQGNRGEVAVELSTDFPERFAERRRLYALDEQGGRRELHLEDFWPHKGRMVLKFAGVDSISDAERLNGCELQIPLAERAPLAEGSVWISDLVGCRVIADGSEVGVIEDLDFTAGEAPLLVVSDGGKRYWIPFVTAYLEQLDLPACQLRMRLPAGMLELDAPLSDEEKRSVASSPGKKEKGKRKKRERETR